MATSTLYLLFKEIAIENANTIAGSLSYGFPALNGIMGAVHNLSRKLQDSHTHLGGVMIVCENYQLHTFQAHPFADAVFKQSRKPLTRKGETAAIIEEGKMHLTLSLIVEVKTNRENWQRLRQESEAEEYCKKVQSLLLQQRIAGGNILSIGKTELFEATKKQEMIANLLPGFVLVDASKELVTITKELQSGQVHGLDGFGEIQELKDELDEPVLTGVPAQPQATALDALIEVATLHHLPPDEQNKEWRTYSVKTGKGWLVPIAVGYQGIAPQVASGEMQNCRTQDYPSQFVETVYSLGKWIFPNRIKSNEWNKYFWRYAPVQNDLYLIQQTDYL